MSSKWIRRSLPCLTLWSALLSAQTIAPEVKPDSPEIRKHLQTAAKAAGKDWPEAEKYFCPATPVPTNKPDDPLFEPVKLFDNLYAIGRLGTAVYAIQTSAGIIMIDAGYEDQVESVLLAGLKKLGLDPANVKTIVIAHGHADHFGGAAYFQSHYGSRVWMAGADWDVVEKQAAARQGKGPGVAAPKRDMAVEEGKPIVLGDVQLTPIFIPGHTPGSIALIFPVKDGTRTRIAGLFGGTVLNPGNPTPEALKQYAQSVAHYADFARRMKVEIEVQNHPLMDGMGRRLAKFQQRKPGDPNPFVVGEAAYQRFVKVMAECTEAQIERRAK